MTAKLTPAEIDTAALAHVGRKRFEKISDKLLQLEQALARGVPLALVCTILAPDFDATAEPIAIAKRWAAEKRDGIQVLRSGLGVGKSVGAAYYAISTGAHWVSASDVAGWTYQDQGEHTRRWVSFPSLVIDEVGGQGTTSPVEAGRLSVVMLSRWAAGLPTTITTNLARGAFAEVYDGADDESISRTLDRIAERGQWCDLRGTSRRKAPADAKAGRRRLEDWRRLRGLVDVVTLAASGFEVDRLDADDGPKAALAALLGATVDDLEAARDELDAAAARITAYAAPFLARWAEEREQAGREQHAAEALIREQLARITGTR